MAVRVRALALAAVLLALGGCSDPTPVPAGVTDAEAEAIALQYQAEFWSRSPSSEGTAFPDVTPLELVSTEAWASRQVTCLLAAGLPAREVSGGFAVDGDGALSPVDSAVAQATCLAQYPIDPRLQGYLSDAQGLYLYDYFTTRLAPCLRLLGFESAAPPDRLAYVGQLRAGIVWTPYLDADGSPFARTAEGWALIDSRCPPPPGKPFRVFGPPVRG